MDRPPQNPANRGAAFALATFSTLFAIAACELFLSLWLANWYDNLALRVYHPQLGHVMPPRAAAEIDRLGFRNRDDGGAVDLVALGDSHTYGFNVPSEKSWPAALSRLTGARVYNMGIGGYGVPQYHHLLSNALAMNPKGIIVALYLANDFHDTCRIAEAYGFWSDYFDAKNIKRTQCVNKPRGPENKDASPRATPIAPDHQPLTMTKPLLERGIIWTEERLFLTSTRRAINGLGFMKRREEKENSARLIAEKPEKYVSFDDPEIGTVLWSFYENSDEEEARVMEGYRLALFLIDEMKKMADDRNIPLGFLIVTGKARNYHPLLERRAMAGADGLMQSLAKELAMEERLMADLASRGIPFVSTAPVMAERLQAGEKLYPATHDGHPVAAGYERYAEAARPLAERLTQKGGGK